MSGQRLDDLGRWLARRDSRRDVLGRAVGAGVQPRNGARIDVLSRALAEPLSRRRAIGVISGTLLAGSVLRPSFAGATTCGGNTPKRCEAPPDKQGNAAFVCVPQDYVCCSTTKCASACRGYQTCADGACSDTSKLCGYPGGGYENFTKFCSVSTTTSNYCTSDEPRQIYLGWCCRGGEVCGTKFRDCTCRGNVCGQYLCCQEGEVCETNFFGTRTACVKRCPDHSLPCNGTECCKGDLICTENGCDCKAGLVQRGIGNCVPMKDDPGNPKWNPFANLANLARDTAAAHGGSQRRFAQTAQSASLPVDAALTAFAAVDGQGAAAALAFREGKSDPAFRHTVRVARAKPPAVVAGPGLDAASAASINKLLAAEAKSYALAAASAKALWRMRAAKAKRQHRYAKTQLRASAKFAGQAASALRGVPALRTAAARALIAGGVAEVTPTEDQVNAFLATIKASGIPGYLRTPLAGLGVGSKDLARLRAGLLTQTVSTASGPALIAPLKDAALAKDLNRVISELAAFSKRARRHPIAH